MKTSTSSKVLLLTRPFYENPTNYLYHWAMPIIKLARSRQLEVIDLSKEKANRVELEGRLKKVNPKLVMFNGHGTSKAILGQDGQVLVEKDKSEPLLAGKIVYARACQTAKTLGKSCVKHKTDAFIGYKEDFIFIFDEAKTTQPLKDKTAAFFFEPSNLVVNSLIKGNSAQQAHNKSRAAFLKRIRQLLVQEADPDNTALVRYLIWDRQQQVCLGNPEASLN